MTAQVVIQARMGSQRLPGKVLADVGGKPMLAMMITRLRRSQTADRLVVATTTTPYDDEIVRACNSLDVETIRGSESDVLSRFVPVARDLDWPIIRLTADCPLIDPTIVDRTVDRFFQIPGCAYASNIVPRSFPDGLDVEVISPSALAQAAARATEPADREHVTPYIRRHAEDSAQAHLVNDEDLSELRWTVDIKSDLEFVRAVVDRLGARRDDANMPEILQVIQESPELRRFGNLVRG